MVEEPVSSDRSGDAERDAEGHRDERREDRQLGRRRRISRQVLANRLVILERLAEIALKQVRQVVPVLEGDRIVEPVALLERRHRFRIGGRLLAEIGRDGVARYELRQRERDERYPQTEENKGARAAQQEAKERLGNRRRLTGRCRS